MSRRVTPNSRETKDVLHALRRAARNALELGMKTGTPVYVMKNGKIVDLTKDPAVIKKFQARRPSAKAGNPKTRRD
jgi:hypothetical protein